MKNSRLGMLSAAAMVLLLGACAAGKPGTGVFSPDGYTNHLYSYHVSGTEGQLLPTGWKLENHYEKGPNLEVKDHYVKAVLIDQDGDGKVDKLHTHPSADLEFRHLEHDGSIWLATMPLSQDQDRSELRVMLQRMVNAISGATTTGSDTTTPFGVFSESKETRLSARVLSQAPAKVSGYPAHVLLLETANADQLELNPDARWRRAEIVLVRTDYLWNSGGAGPFPVFLVAGYSNFPEDFDRGIEDFHRFMSNLNLEVRRLPAEEEPLAKECAPDANRIRIAVIKKQKNSVRALSSLDADEEGDECLTKAILGNKSPVLPWEELSWVIGGIREGVETTLATPSSEGTGAAPTDPNAADPAAADPAATDPNATDPAATDPDAADPAAAPASSAGPAPEANGAAAAP